MTNKGERFCFHIPEEGAEYVHNNMKENEFIKDLIGWISHHGCKMQDIFVTVPSAFGSDYDRRDAQR